MISPNTEIDTNTKYKGVAGWLMLLCVGLTILGPLRSLVTLVQGYNESSPHFERIPGLRTLATIDIPLSLALISFSIYAGLRLWQIKPGAVQTAKKFYICMLAYTAISVTLPFMVELPQQATSAMQGEALKEIIQSAVSVGIWYFYLRVSKRVKATYPDAA